jgi:prevent-host-death family protein
MGNSSTQPPSETVQMADLRANLRDILERAAYGGKQLIVERYGSEFVVILPPAEYRRLLAQAAAANKPDTRQSNAKR